MSMIDVDSLLQELDPAAPCGPNLEYDPAFLALEQAAQGKPEVQYGDTITPAVPPEWKQVKAQALELLARTRDLRVALPLLRALLALHGVLGLADALGLIERLLAERWDSVHPQLDPDDDMDPMLRINSLAMLADGATVLREVKEAPLLVLPGLGPLSLRLLDIASGELATPEGQDHVAQSSIEAALRDVDPDKVAQVSDALARAYASAVNIELGLVRQVGSAQALNLDALVRSLRRLRDFMAAHNGEAAGDTGGADTGSAEAGSAPASGARAAPAAISGEISDRADVLRMLDKICKYYQQYEPSSPVPLLLQRARRLVPKNFFEIMEDLAPDGVAQLTVISGPQVEASQDE